MKLLFVTSEANPYAASGGLGDVMGALPAALAENSDNEVSVIMPYYNTVSETYRSQMKKVADISFKLSWRSTGATIYSLVDRCVTYYFGSFFFGWSRIYLSSSYKYSKRYKHRCNRS